MLHGSNSGWYIIYSQQRNLQQAKVNSYKIARVQLGDEWPSPVGETHKHCSRNTGKASDSCKLLGHRRYCRPVLVHAWVYIEVYMKTTTTPCDNKHVNGRDDGQVYWHVQFPKMALHSGYCHEVLRRWQSPRTGRLSDFLIYPIFVT